MELDTRACAGERPTTKTSIRADDDEADRKKATARLFHQPLDPALAPRLEQRRDRQRRNRAARRDTHSNVARASNVAQEREGREKR
eukprot:6176341-Pleurochrysis_carterae.AAC.3